MTDLLPRGYFTDGALLNGGAKAGHDQNVEIFHQLLGGPAPTVAQIAGGTLNPVAGGTTNPDAGAPYIRVRTENDAAADDLSNIVQTGYREGAFVMLTAEVTSGNTTIKSGAGGNGQIFIADGQDLLLDTEAVSVLLQRIGNAFYERLRFYRGMTLAEGLAGLNTGLRALSADVLKGIVEGLAPKQRTLTQVINLAGQSSVVSGALPASREHILTFRSVEPSQSAEVLLELRNAGGYSTAGTGSVHLFGSGLTNDDWTAGVCKLALGGGVYRWENKVILTKNSNDSYAIGAQLGISNVAGSGIQSLSSGRIDIANLTQFRLSVSVGTFAQGVVQVESVAAA